MMNLLLLLLVKSTIVLGMGALTAWILRTRTAAARHLVWLATLAALLLLPFGLLIPDSATPAVWTIRTTAAASPVGQLASTAAQWTTVFALIWASGIILLILRVAVAGRRALSIVKRARITGAVAEYPVYVGDDLAAPLAWSFGRGKIVLPADSERWTGEEYLAVVKHETAHLARQDCQALLIAELACALYWFHPLVWYAARRLRVEQEHAADDSVLQGGLEPADYAARLVAMVRAQRNELLMAGVGTRSTLSARVEAILDPKRRRTMLTRRMLLATAVAVVGIVVPLAAMHAERRVYKFSTDGVTAPQVLHKEEPAYTEEAKDARIQGSVLLTGVIETDGRLSNVEVKRSLDPGLDQKAVEAVHRWLFKPSEKNGTPVAVSASIEINFRLK